MSMFAAPTAAQVRSRSTEVAVAALPPGGTVLDVGCGGGAAAFALVPPAARLIGTDRQEDMLRLFAEHARHRVVVDLTEQHPQGVPGADVAALLGPRAAVGSGRIAGGEGAGRGSLASWLVLVTRC